MSVINQVPLGFGSLLILRKSLRNELLAVTSTLGDLNQILKKERKGSERKLTLAEVVEHAARKAWSFYLLNVVGDFRVDIDQRREVAEKISGGVGDGTGAVDGSTENAQCNQTNLTQKEAFWTYWNIFIAGEISQGLFEFLCRPKPK